MMCRGGSCEDLSRPTSHRQLLICKGMGSPNALCVRHVVAAFNTDSGKTPHVVSFGHGPWAKIKPLDSFRPVKRRFGCPPSSTRYAQVHLLPAMARMEMEKPRTVDLWWPLFRGPSRTRYPAIDSSCVDCNHAQRTFGGLSWSPQFLAEAQIGHDALEQPARAATACRRESQSELGQRAGAPRRAPNRIPPLNQKPLHN